MTDLFLSGSWQHLNGDKFFGSDLVELLSQPKWRYPCSRPGAARDTRNVTVIKELEREESS